MDRTKTVKVLVLDNMRMTYLSQRINRLGANTILAFDDSRMYPYFDNADGVSAANPDYDPREAGKNTIEMLDDLNPDLILLGNCQGAGIDKSQLFPENKKAVTIVVSNERLVGPELKLYTDRNFERFCVRTELIRSFPSFLLEVKVLRDPKLEL